VLIAFSGIVGSGKSTAARQAFELLQREGADVEYLRFRSIGTLPFRQRALSTTNADAAAGGAAGVRRKGYRQRPLSAVRTCGYIARILSFRVARWGAAHHVVCDRYFYDNLVHYTAHTRRGRACLWLLMRLIPRPDLAVLLVASPETIAQRRPEYAREYVTGVCRAYAELPQRCPKLVAVATDGPEPALPHILDLVRRRVLRSGGDAPAGASPGHRSDPRSFSW
jgi:thymidylate kinase